MAITIPSTPFTIPTIPLPAPIPGPPGPPGPPGAGVSLGIVNVKDLGADGRDRLYTNIVGGSGYTGGSASNLALHPTGLSSWNLANVTITPNARLDPRGALLADAVTETALPTVAHGAQDGLGTAFTGGSTIRYDVELHPGLRTWVRVELFDGGSATLQVLFNLSGTAGVVGSSLMFGGATLTNATITALPNGWYVCMIEGTFPGGSTQVQPNLQSALGDFIYFDNASDPNQFYTGSTASAAFYVALNRIYAVNKYLGSVFIAGDSIFTGVALTGGTGTGARANIVVGLGQVLEVDSYCPGANYTIGDTLSCAAADIGGTGSGFTCQVQTFGNDSAAIQAAIDSGNGSPITVYFPPGTYNVFPPDNRGSHCLRVRHNNVTMRGAGRMTTKLQFFVSGGRHPETSYDVPATGGNAGFVWRGCGFQLNQQIQNLEWRGLRLTGMCKRHNNRWPLGGSDPQVISGGNPLGHFGDGDGWDESHLCISRFNRTTPIDRNLRVIDCELDSWKGEIVGSIGDFVTPADDTSQWTWWIENNYIHDTHADCISSSGNVMVLGNEIGWATNGMEEGTAICHTFFRDNHIHDTTHGITIVVGTDTGASTTCTGQQIIQNNFFERCYLNGIFVFQFQCNVLIESNVFVDCGVTSSITGGAVNLSLLSGSQPYANVFLRENLIYSHTRNIQSPIGLGMSLSTGAALKGVYIEDNRVAQTPNAQSLSFAPATPWTDNLASGTYAEVIHNDMRTTTAAYNPAGVAFPLRLDNVLDLQNRYAEIRLGSLSVTNNTLVDIPNMTETISDSTAVWFEALLFVTAPAGGAQVAVVATGSVSSTRYDVELWAGTTLDAASGQGTASGTAFGSNAAITKIRISGVLQVNVNSQGTFLKLQFAQNTTNASASQVLANSWFKVRNRL